MRYNYTKKIKYKNVGENMKYENINNLKNDLKNCNITVDNVNYNDLKKNSVNIGSGKRPRYSNKKMNANQIKLIEKFQNVENIQQLCNLINKNDEVINDNYNYYFVVKHLKKCIKLVKNGGKNDKIIYDYGIVSKYLSKMNE